MSGADRRLVLRADVVSTVLQNGAVLLDLKSKFFYSLNGAGWAVAQCLEGGATRAEVHEACRAVGAGPIDAPAIDGVFDYMVSEALVEEGQGPGPDPAGLAVPGGWSTPTINRHAEPLQRIMVSAFDPGIPIAE